MLEVAQIAAVAVMKYRWLNIGRQPSSPVPPACSRQAATYSPRVTRQVITTSPKVQGISRHTAIMTRFSPA